DYLTLRGEKKRATETTGRDYYYAERSYGAFVRTIPLPCDVNVDKAVAKYKNGVLRVTLPKTEEAKAKRIRVKIRS
ncbi:Hsp20/alpha crystallin family protein, partial [Candidatus Parcubacteria bacterium]